MNMPIKKCLQQLTLHRIQHQDQQYSEYVRGGEAHSTGTGRLEWSPAHITKKQRP
jgi:hypothetical protein